MNLKKFLGMNFFLKLLLCLTLFLPEPANAFVYLLKVYRNKNTGKTVTLLGDYHTVFSRELNLAQMNAFLKILNTCEQHGEQTDVLHEDLSLFGKELKHSSRLPITLTRNDLGQYETNAYQYERLKGTYKKYRFPKLNTTWITTDLYSLFQQKDFRSITLRSIDPRFQIFNSENYCKEGTYCDILSVAEFDEHVDSEEFKKLLNEDKALKTEIDLIDSKLQKDLDAVFKGRQERKEMLSCTIQQLLDKQILGDEEMEEISSKLKTNHMFFASALDKIALLSIQRSQAMAHNSIVVTGSFHTGFIGRHLENMGYESIYAPKFPGGSTEETERQMWEIDAYYFRGNPDVDMEINFRINADDVDKGMTQILELVCNKTQDHFPAPQGRITETKRPERDG